MRVSKERAAENRERILDAASRLLREPGISGAGVDALTEAAGMTHGSLYSQFGSKVRLVEEALTHAMSAKAQNVTEDLARSAYISPYLSTTHRDTWGNGCSLAALACDVARQGQGVRQRYTACVA